MATYPIKMLRDEDRQAFVPFTNAAAIVDKDNNSLQELMDSGKYKIQNNVTTSSAGKGVLDAYQGKVLNDKFNNYVPLSQKGVANGVASLDAEGKVPSAQLPSYVDDVIESYIVSGSTALSAGWLSATNGGTALTPEKGKIYLIMTSGAYQNKQYRWGGSTYVLCNPSDVNSVNGMTGVVTLKKLTIQKNGTQVGDTFNGTTDEVINITVPTNNNQLTNGAGYITSAGSITGNAATATKATQDSSGNVIVDTYVKKAGDTMTGALKTPRITISGTDSSAHVSFERDNYNYIRATGTNGIIAVIAGGKAAGASANADLIIAKNIVRPGTTNLVDLGTSDIKWKNVYATTFQGNATSASKLATARTITIDGDINGSASFNGSANITITTNRRPYVHNVVSNGETAMYTKIATISIAGGHQNEPIEFTVARRADLTPTRISIRFASQSDVTVLGLPLVYTFGATKNVWVHQTSSGTNPATFDLYVAKTEAWDNIGVVDYYLPKYMGTTTITWKTDMVETLPTTNIVQAVWGYTVGTASIAEVANQTKAALTIQKNGVAVGSTFNGSTARTINITVPTKVTDLSDNTNYIKKTDYASASSAGVVKLGTGLAIADGVLSVTGAATADSVEWSVVKNRPTAVSYWTNDAGYIKASNTMKGATATTAGSAGTVPAPAAGKEAQFLRGDGTWAVPSYATSAGTATKIGSTTVGSNIRPIYISSGTPTVCNQVKSGTYTNAVPYIGADGVMEVGSHIDFHTNTSTNDFDARLYTNGTNLYSTNNFVPNGVNQTLGLSSSPWKNVYASTFNGKLSYIDTTGSTFLTVGSDNKDTTILRVYSSDSSSGTDAPTASADYGYSLVYKGTGSGNDNSLILYSDNQTGTRVAAMTMLQGGSITLGSTLTTKDIFATKHIYLNGVASSSLDTTTKIIFGNASTAYAVISANTSNGLLFGNSLTSGTEQMGYLGNYNAFAPGYQNTTATLGCNNGDAKYQWTHVYTKSVDLDYAAQIKYNSTNKCIDFIFN